MAGALNDNDLKVQEWEGEWDDDGVWVYQAYNDEIAAYALKHQRFGGPLFNPLRMTWFKPSFAWVLYRSGYGRKHNQTRVLKVKLPHEVVAEVLGQCACGHGAGGGNGRVQWDPARDLMSSEAGKPRKFLRKRAIQVGVKGELSKRYVEAITEIVDVTELSHRIGDAHARGSSAAVTAAMAELESQLPFERPYVPHCPDKTLVDLALRPGECADWVARIGCGKATLI